MRHAEVTLDDKFLLTGGRVFITGVQALLRVLIDQHRLDAAAGLKTAHDPASFKRIASARTLYHWNADANQEY